MSKCQLCGLLITDEFPSGFGGTEQKPIHVGAPNLCLDAARSEIMRLRAEVARLSESEQQLQAENERLCREALRRLWRSDDVRRAIDATPAFPGDMTDSVWEKLNGNRAATQDALRWAVIETKKEILRRLNALDDALDAAREEE